MEELSAITKNLVFSSLERQVAQEVLDAREKALAKTSPRQWNHPASCKADHIA
jgi:hypothetical protein